MFTTHTTSSWRPDQNASNFLEELETMLLLTRWVSDTQIFPAGSMIVRASLICLLAARAASGQNAPLERTCYQFDRPYFTAVGRFPGGSVFTRRAEILKFRVDSTPAISPRWPRLPMRAVEPVPFVLDSFTYHRWMSMSGWRMIGTDSVEIHWRNGLYGPVFRMALRGDSLVGAFVQTTDFHRIPEPPSRPPEMAFAVRMPCEG